MNDDVFDFDIDAELAKAEANAAHRAKEVPQLLEDEEDCESCKI
ncbi:hypothetical protein [Serratia sp. UGAL515B_01]|nr:hypothetical protein [Serratia sp. UGAL515B_01]WON78332.1 hypothetical protein OK023_06690 [Serratia sp. UGAL515B_01]